MQAFRCDRRPYDVPLQDTALREEFELTTLLIIAANESETLPQSRIDAILGSEHHRHG